jgi:hypothetical protein
MFRILATRCMLQAVYFASGAYQKEDYHHYGLAVPLYTHFTSPIRRYADIIVHRLLAVVCGSDSTYPDLVDKKKTSDLCVNLNYRNRMAQYAGRASIAFNTHVRISSTVLLRCNNCVPVVFQRKAPRRGGLRFVRAKKCVANIDSSIRTRVYLVFGQERRNFKCF